MELRRLRAQHLPISPAFLGRLAKRGGHQALCSGGDMVSRDQQFEPRWVRPERHRQDRRIDVLIVVSVMAGAIGGLLGFLAL